MNESKNKFYEAYPLYWPDGWARTKPGLRAGNHSWKKTFAQYHAELLAELRRMGAKGIVVSTNVPLRKDGLPYLDYRRVDDPGAAVYFRRGAEDKPYCLACDKFRDVHLNIHAIGLTIEALRTIERNGATDMLERAFEGFKQLAEKASDPWREVLDLTHRDPAQLTVAELDQAFKKLARKHHPDLGGDPARFQQIVRARDEGRAELEQRKEIA